MDLYVGSIYGVCLTHRVNCGSILCRLYIYGVCLTQRVNCGSILCRLYIYGVCLTHRANCGSIVMQALGFRFLGPDAGDFFLPGCRSPGLASGKNYWELMYQLEQGNP